MSKEWFVLQLKANAHNRAVKNLNQQGFETFLPLLNLTSRKGSRFLKKKQPLFPGYLFITFDKADEKWSKINNTYGVSRLITFNCTLKSIPSSFINNLIDRYDCLGELIPVKKIEKGDQVKFLQGPFANFLATVETLEPNNRIWVLMDLMGRQAKIKAHKKDIQLST